MTEPAKDSLVARVTRPATSHPTAIFIRACSSRCPAAMSDARSSSIFGGTRSSLPKCVPSAEKTCRRVLPARISEPARAARAWPTWRATCAALPPPIAKNLSSALALRPPACSRAKPPATPRTASSRSNLRTPHSDRRSAPGEGRSPSQARRDPLLSISQVWTGRQISIPRSIFSGWHVYTDGAEIQHASHSFLEQ